MSASAALADFFGRRSGCEGAFQVRERMRQVNGLSRSGLWLTQRPAESPPWNSAGRCFYT